MLGRLGLSVTGFSVGIFFISWQMTENHLAHPRNPAWQFVSGLRWLLLALWTIAAVIYACFLILEALGRRRLMREKIKLKAQEEERMRLERIARAQRYEKEELERKRLEAEKQIELAIKQQQEADRREQIRKAHIEKMKSRSPDEATNEALKDFF